MEYTENEYKLGAEINKQLSDIKKSMTMNDQLNEHKIDPNKPYCPYCGSSNINDASDISSGKYVHVAFCCNDCYRHFIHPRFEVLPHQIKTYNSIEEREKAKSDEDNLGHMPSVINDLMAEKGFTTVNQAIDFLAQHYSKTKDLTKPKKCRTSPGKMTIDDVEKYIKVHAYPNSPCGHMTTNTSITITYVKTFTETMESIDTATFICSSINNLKYQWIEFLRKTGLQEDCIASFSVDISIRDKAYIEDMNSALDSLIDTIYVDDKNITSKKITEEDRQEILKNILGSSYFGGSDKIIYPHIITSKDPNTGIMVKSVERYWGE